MLPKPTTTSLLCPRCDAACKLAIVNELVPQFRTWVCSANVLHRFAPGYEAVYEERRLARQKPVR